MHIHIYEVFSKLFEIIIGQFVLDMFVTNLLRIIIKTISMSTDYIMVR